MSRDAMERNEEVYQWAMLGALMANKAVHASVTAGDFVSPVISAMAQELLSGAKSRPTVEGWLLKPGVPGVDANVKAVDALAMVVRAQCVADQLRELLGKLTFGTRASAGQTVNAAAIVLEKITPLLDGLARNQHAK